MRTKTETGFPVAAGILFGLGLGGFIDGIVLHQILQWHHSGRRRLRSPGSIGSRSPATGPRAARRRGVRMLDWSDSFSIILKRRRQRGLRELDSRVRAAAG